MKVFLVLGICAYAVSWFLPAIDMPEMAGLGKLAQELGQEVAKAAPELGHDRKVEASDFDFGKLGIPAMSSGMKGYEAAQAVFDALRDAFRSKQKAPERLRVIWWNLANPLFILAVFAALSGRTALVALFATAGAVSAGYWVGASDLPAESFGIGYWLWFGSFVELALVGWLSSFSSSARCR